MSSSDSRLLLNGTIVWIRYTCGILGLYIFTFFAKNAVDKDSCGSKVNTNILRAGIVDLDKVEINVITSCYLNSQNEEDNVFLSGMLRPKVFTQPKCAFRWGTKVYVQNPLEPSSGILHHYHLTRGSTLTSQDYSPSSVVCAPKTD